MAFFLFQKFVKWRKPSYSGWHCNRKFEVLSTLLTGHLLFFFLWRNLPPSLPNYSLGEAGPEMSGNYWPTQSCCVPQRRQTIPVLRSQTGSCRKTRWPWRRRTSPESAIWRWLSADSCPWSNRIWFGFNKRSLPPSKFSSVFLKNLQTNELTNNKAEK